MRKDKKGNTLIVAMNLTPIPRYDYKIGVNQSGVYHEVLNTDSEIYGGSGVHNTDEIHTLEPGWDFKPYQIKVVLPPLSMVCFQIKAEK
jgi:1,4-alpha-glucan branching enzyme